MEQDGEQDGSRNSQIKVANCLKLYRAIVKHSALLNYFSVARIYTGRKRLRKPTERIFINSRKFLQGLAN